MPLPTSLPRPRWSALVAVALLVGTLWPTPGAPQPLERFCIICGSLGGLDFVANVVVFVPLGMALVRDGYRGRFTWLAGLALSLAIELLQWKLIPGRDASAGDLISNTLGTWVGWMLAVHRASLWRPDRDLARGILAAWCLGATVIGGVAAWSLRAAAPAYVYFTQWTPVRGGYAPLTGDFRGLRLFGERLPNATPVDPSDRPAAYARGELDLEGIVTGPDLRETRPVLLARLGNPLGEQAQLVQRGDALVFRGRRNASRLGLRSPTFVLDSAWLPRGETSFRVRSVSRDVELAAGRTATIPVTLGRFWHTLAPFEVQYSQPEPFMAALFLLGLLLPAGFYARRASVKPMLAAPLGVAVVVLGALPLWAGITPGGTPEIVGAVVGALGGHALGAPGDK